MYQLPVHQMVSAIVFPLAQTRLSLRPQRFDPYLLSVRKSAVALSAAAPPQPDQATLRSTLNGRVALVGAFVAACTGVLKPWARLPETHIEADLASRAEAIPAREPSHAGQSRSSLWRRDDGIARLGEMRRSSRCRERAGRVVSRCDMKSAVARSPTGAVVTEQSARRRRTPKACGPSQ